MHYRVHSTKVRCLRWYPTKAQAIAAFESATMRIGLSCFVAFIALSTAQALRRIEA